MCLAPQSYCLAVGNEANAVAKGFEHEFGSSASMFLGKIKTFSKEHECNVHCLSSDEALVTTTAT